jgi:ribose-phosphate pyrophosphokinase
MLIYSLDVDSAFATALAAELDATISAHEDRAFEDGEHKLRPLVDPRGDDVYVVSSLHGGPHDSPHDKLCRLLMFVSTLRDHGAGRVSAVLPYLAYARKDRQTKPFDPVTLRYIAQWFEAAGADQLMVLEAHNVSALQNAFRRPTRHLEAHRLFDPIAVQVAAHGPIAVVSPDPGGVKRAQLWRESLEARLARPVGFAMIDKRRSGGVVSSMGLVAGEVEGATALVLDDLIASGTTMQHAATALRRQGAREVIAFAAHGLFTGSAPEVLADAAISRIVVTDSVPPFRLDPAGRAAAKLTVVSAAALFAQAIRDSHQPWEA